MPTRIEARRCLASAARRRSPRLLRNRWRYELGRFGTPGSVTPSPPSWVISTVRDSQPSPSLSLPTKFSRRCNAQKFGGGSTNPNQRELQRGFRRGAALASAACDGASGLLSAVLRCRAVRRLRRSLGSPARHRHRARLTSGSLPAYGECSRARARTIDRSHSIKTFATHPMTTP